MEILAIALIALLLYGAGRVAEFGKVAAKEEADPEASSASTSTRT